jgi:hypothetical protein
MEMTSLDLVEGNMSISEVQTRGLARRGIEVNPEKSYAACSGVEICASIITMAVKGGVTRRPGKSLHYKHGYVDDST